MNQANQVNLVKQKKPEISEKQPTETSELKMKLLYEPSKDFEHGKTVNLMKLVLTSFISK